MRKTKRWKLTLLRMQKRKNVGGHFIWGERFLLASRRLQYGRVPMLLGGLKFEGTEKLEFWE
jgi:hypothetical protein